MKKSLVLGGAAAVLAALFTVSVFAQADATNFNRRANGGADVRQEITRSTLPPSSSTPTIQSWLTAAAGKTFTINAPPVINAGMWGTWGTWGTVRVIVSGSGDSVNVQRIDAHSSRQLHSVILTPLSPVGGYDWPTNHGNAVYNYRVSLSPAGISLSMIQTELIELVHDSGYETVFHVLQGAVPVDALIARPSGYVFTAPQVYTSMKTLPVR